ncbi:MAG: hypothetical protein KGO81_07825 [Bacteroidota bacterium]|nr:hypothetical protein [Bacteroidota bacterium]
MIACRSTVNCKYPEILKVIRNTLYVVSEEGIRKRSIVSKERTTYNIQLITYNIPLRALCAILCDLSGLIE